MTRSQSAEPREKRPRLSPMAKKSKSVDAEEIDSGINGYGDLSSSSQHINKLPEDQINYQKLQLKTIDFSSSDVNGVKPKLFHKSRSWKDTVPRAEAMVKQALSSGRLGTADHPICLFDENIVLRDELLKYKGTKMFPVIGRQLIDSIRFRIAPDFLLSPVILSELLHTILLPDAGAEAELPGQVCLLLQTFLRMYPPINTQFRQYWLQVLSKSICDKFGKDKNQTSKARDPSTKARDELCKRVNAFRDVVIPAFSTGRNTALQSFLLDLLEIDLWSFQCKTLDLNAFEIMCFGYSQDLEDKPLAYLLFVDSNDKLTFDISKDSKAKIIEFKELLNFTSRTFNLCGRLLAVVFEAVHYLADIHLPDLMVNRHLCLIADIQEITRKMGISKKLVGELLPIKWVNEVIAPASET